VILENKDLLKNTTQNETLAAIRNLFEKNKNNISKTSTTFFKYVSYPENIYLNITEASANFSTIKGKI
jgi:hypothetical protein